MRIKAYICFWIKLGLFANPLIFYGQQNSEQDSLQEIIIYQPNVYLHSGLKNKNVSILTVSDIENLPVTNIAELLSYVSGVDVKTRGPFASQSDISIDGGGFDQNIIMINGQSISDAQTGHNSLNMPISMDLVQRVEVIKGPSARLFGANSLTGVINIVTKNPKESRFFASGLVGSNFTKDLESNSKEFYNNRTIEFGGSMLGQNSDHLFSIAHGAGNGSRYNTDFYNDKIFYQGRFKWNSDNAIQLLGGYAKSKFGANGFYAYPSDKESQEIVQTSLLHIKGSHQISHRFTLLPSIGVRYNFDDYRFYRHDLNTARSRHYNTGVQTSFMAEYLFDNAQVNFGAQGEYFEINSTNMGNHKKNNYGLFFEYSTSLWSDFTLNMGGYLNYTSNYGWQFYPGIDLAYLVSSNWRIMGNVGTATRLPTFADLYLDQRPGNIGNPDLNPEKAYQIELGSKYDSKSFQASSFVFYRDIREFIDWVREDHNHAYQTINLGNNRTFGWNADLKYHFITSKINWHLAASYTYLDPSIVRNDNKIESKYLLDGLKHQFIASITSRIKCWNITLASGYKQRFSYKSYWVNNFKISYNKTKYVVFLDVQNFTSTTFIEAGVVPLPKAWFSLGVKYRSK